MKVLIWFLLASAPLTSALAPKIQKRSTLKVSPTVNNNQPVFDPLNLADNTSVNPRSSLPQKSNAFLISSAALLATPATASAATAVGGAGPTDSIASAVVAYGHYLSFFGMVACVTYERFAFKAFMSNEEEDGVAFANTLLGGFVALMAYTGYLKVVEYGKGWEFYQNEPMFWVKIGLVGVMAAASLFNTTKITQRSVVRKFPGADPNPMGTRLASQMQQICNIELIALALIPFTSTLMSRSVIYSNLNDFEWETLATGAGGTFGVLSVKFIIDALTFQDGPMADISWKDLDSNEKAFWRNMVSKTQDKKLDGAFASYQNNPSDSMEKTSTAPALPGTSNSFVPGATFDGSTTNGLEARTRENESIGL